MDFDFGDWENASWGKNHLNQVLENVQRKNQWKTEEKDIPGSKNIA